LPLNTTLLIHRAPMVLLLFYTFLFLLSWISQINTNHINAVWEGCTIVRS
jgi:hypothetical protein